LPYLCWESWRTLSPAASGEWFALWASAALALLWLGAQAPDPPEIPFRTFADLAHDWEYWADQSGRILYSSPSCERITGYSAREFEADPGLLGRIVHPEDQDRWGTCHRSLFAGDQPADPGALEYRIVRRDGEARWIEHRCVAVIDAEGRQIGRRATGRDVTDRKRAEETARLQRLALDQISDRVTLADLSGRISYANAAACRFLGRDRESLIGQSLWLFTRGQAELQAKKIESEQRILAVGEWRGEVENRTPEGEPSVTYLRKALVRDEHGAPLAICGVGTDITELKRAERARIESEAALRAVFACMDDLVLVLDREGRYVDLAPANPELMYKPWADMAGKTLDEVLPPESAALFLDVIGRTIRERCTQHVDYPLPIRGKQRWFSAAVSPLGDDKVVWVSRDVTSRRTAQEELRRREAHYRAVIETSTDGFLALDMEGRILEVNDAYVRRSGYSREQLLRMRLEELDARETRAELAAHGERIRKTGSDLFETLHRTADGAEWRVEVSVSYWPIGGGRLFVFLRDLLRRSVSDALLRARLRLSDLANRVGRAELVRATVEEARLATGSRRGYFQFGGQAAPARMPAAHELSAPAMRGGKLRALLTVCDKATGYSEGDAVALSGLASLALEVLERQQTQAALRESEERYRHVVSLASDGIVLQSATGKVLTFNATAERVFGISAAQAKRHSSMSRDWGVIHEDGTAWAGEDHPSMVTLRTGQPCRDCVMGVRRADGGFSWLSVNSEPMRAGAKGPLTGVVVTFSDITARKRMEDDLRRSLARNEALLREVHHRVKNNLAAVVGLIELQRASIHDEEAARALGELQGRLRAMAIVHEKLYRTEDPAAVDFADYLRTLVGELRAGRAFRGRMECVAQAGVTLSLDLATPCGMIVNELATNALNHAFPDGAQPAGGAEPRISVGIALAEGEYCLTVSDNGIGLPEGLDPDSTRSLGLRLVRMLAEHQLGGRVNTRRENGTTVCVRFDPAKRR
jgi:PAS domain S-box-containing protein